MLSEVSQRKTDILYDPSSMWILKHKTETVSGTENTLMAAGAGAGTWVNKVMGNKRCKLPIIK